MRSGSFETRLGGSIRWTSVFVCLLLVLTRLLLTALQIRSSGFFWWGYWLAASGLAVLLAGAWLLRPVGYEIGSDGVFVLRPVGRKRLAERVDAAFVDDAAMRRALRLFGNGGLFAFSGWFRNSKYGTFRAWVTDPSTLVVLRHDGTTTVVSPCERERFIAAFELRHT